MIRIRLMTNRTLTWSTMLAIISFASQVCSRTDALSAESEPTAPAVSATSQSEPATATTDDSAVAEPKLSVPKTAETKSTTSDAQDAEQVKLRYQFHTGQFVHYRAESSSRMVLTAREVTQTLSESRETQKHYRVVTVAEDGSAVLEPVIDRIRARAQSDDGAPVDFDSETDEIGAGAFSRFKETVGRPVVRVRFTPRGNVADVLPLNGDKSQPGVEEDAEKHAFLIPFPEEAVSPGETWDHDFKVRVSVDAKLQTKIAKLVSVRRRYTFERMVDGIAEITFKTYPLSLESDPNIQVQLVQRTLLGTIRFDTQRGIILTSTSRGAGSVFNAFGPLSAMKAQSSTQETYVQNPQRRPGPAGPALPDSSGE